MFTLSLVIIIVGLSIWIIRAASEIKTSEMVIKQKSDELKDKESKLVACWERAKNDERVIKRLEVDAQRDEVRLKEAESLIRELNQKLRERSSIKAVKFVANVPHKGWTSTEFKLGVGPCGLEVVSLQWSEMSDRYVLTQWHSDKTRKTFEYMKEDVKGRIEKHYS